MSDANITEEEDMSEMTEEDIGNALAKMTEEDIGNALANEIFPGLMRRFESEYETMTQEDLLQKWYFVFESSESLRYNTYRFMKYLDLYKHSCRKWEENNNGHFMVVERVRDKYLLPKIDEFLATLREHM